MSNERMFGDTIDRSMRNEWIGQKFALKRSLKFSPENGAFFRPATCINSGKTLALITRTVANAMALPVAFRRSVRML